MLDEMRLCIHVMIMMVSRCRMFRLFTMLIDKCCVGEITRHSLSRLFYDNEGISYIRVWELIK